GDLHGADARAAVRVLRRAAPRGAPSFVRRSTRRPEESPRENRDMTARRPLLALKVDVDTLRGTREGVPRLVEIFQRRGAAATFLFSVGPDHTGRALKRVFRRGFLSKVSRTSVLTHYGLRTLLYGTLLPGPMIGRSCAQDLRA